MYRCVERYFIHEEIIGRVVLDLISISFLKFIKDLQIVLLCHNYMKSRSRFFIQRWHEKYHFLSSYCHSFTSFHKSTTRVNFRINVCPIHGSRLLLRIVHARALR